MKIDNFMRGVTGLLDAGFTCEIPEMNPVRVLEMSRNPGLMFPVSLGVISLLFDNERNLTEKVVGLGSLMSGRESELQNSFQLLDDDDDLTDPPTYSTSRQITAGAVGALIQYAKSSQDIEAIRVLCGGIPFIRTGLNDRDFPIVGDVEYLFDGAALRRIPHEDPLDGDNPDGEWRIYYSSEEKLRAFLNGFIATTWLRFEREDLSYGFLGKPPVGLDKYPEQAFKQVLSTILAEIDENSFAAHMFIGDFGTGKTNFVGHLVNALSRLGFGVVDVAPDKLEDFRISGATAKLYSRVVVSVDEVEKSGDATLPGNLLRTIDSVRNQIFLTDNECFPQVFLFTANDYLKLPRALFRKGRVKVWKFEAGTDELITSNIHPLEAEAVLKELKSQTEE